MAHHGSQAHSHWGLASLSRHSSDRPPQSSDTRKKQALRSPSDSQAQRSWGSCGAGIPQWGCGSWELAFHIIPRNARSALGTGGQQWQARCPVDAGGTYHDLGDALFSVLCCFTLYCPVTEPTPLITLCPLLVTNCTPLHHARILWGVWG